MKNGYSVSGTPPPLESTQVATVTATASQQVTHAQTHPQQPRFLYAAPTPGAPYGAQPQLQLYAFHPPTSFYTPTLLQAWPSTTAAGAPFFDLGSVFTMNGLSPQATFKPSPNPRYQNMGGRGRGHRRNMSHNNSSNTNDASSTPTATSNQQGSAAAGNFASNGNGKNSATSAVNAPVVGNGPASFTPAKGVAAAATHPQQSSNNSHSSGSSRDKEGFNSTSQHQVQQKSASEGVSAVGGYPNEDRRPQEANDRGMGDRSGERSSYGFGGRGRSRPRGDRSNRGNGGYSHFRGANGSYRGVDRDGRDMRHGGGGGNGSYQGRVGANGPHPLQQSANSSATSPAPDFDLRAESSFPPLPGLEAGALASASATVSTGVSAVSAELHAKHDEVNGESGGVSSAAVVGNGSAWESKLSDVVKGVAKIGKSHSQAAQKPLLNGPPVVSSMAAVVAPPSKASLDQNPLPNGDLAQSTLALTPPTSPGKKDRAAPFPPTAAVTAPKAAAAAAATTATGDAAQSKAVMAPPSVSYAKMAEQSKERLEQLAREVKERELEQERERRREAARLSQTKVTTNQGKMTGRPGATVGPATPTASSSAAAAAVSPAVAATATAATATTVPSSSSSSSSTQSTNRGRREQQQQQQQSKANESDDVASSECSKSP